MRRIIVTGLLAMFVLTAVTNIGCKAKVDDTGASVKVKNPNL